MTRHTWINHEKSIGRPYSAPLTCHPHNALKFQRFTTGLANSSKRPWGNKTPSTPLHLESKDLSNLWPPSYHSPSSTWGLLPLPLCIFYFWLQSTPHPPSCGPLLSGLEYLFREPVCSASLPSAGVQGGRGDLKAPPYSCCWSMEVSVVC